MLVSFPSLEYARAFPFSSPCIFCSSSDTHMIVLQIFVITWRAIFFRALAQYSSLFSSTGPYFLLLDFLLFSFIALIFSTVFCHPILSYFPHYCVCGWVIYFVLAGTAWSSLGILSLFPFLISVSMVFRALWLLKKLDFLHGSLRFQSFYLKRKIQVAAGLPFLI